MNWQDPAAVRRYKRLDMRRRRFSTRIQERRNINWNDREQVNAYKRGYYRAHYPLGRWQQIVQKFLGLP